MQLLHERSALDIQTEEQEQIHADEINVLLSFSSAFDGFKTFKIFYADPNNRWREPLLWYDRGDKFCDIVEHFNIEFKSGCDFFKNDNGNTEVVFYGQHEEAHIEILAD